MPEIAKTGRDLAKRAFRVHGAVRHRVAPSPVDTISAATVLWPWPDSCRTCPFAAAATGHFSTGAAVPPGLRHAPLDISRRFRPKTIVSGSSENIRVLAHQRLAKLPSHQDVLPCLHPASLGELISLR